MQHKVVAEFVDLFTGERYYPAPAGAEPAVFSPHSDDQRARLIAARCLAPEPITTDPLDHDGDGARGGSLPGEESTVAKGRRKKAESAA